MVDGGLMTHTVETLGAPLEVARPVPQIPWMRRIEEHLSWPILSRLPVIMVAEIPLSRFRIRDLLALAEGQVFESGSPDTEDVPLKVGDVQMGWTEFEVVEQRIALRLTRLV